MTPRQAASEIDIARQSIHDIFADWRNSPIPSTAANILARVLALLAPMRSVYGAESPVPRGLLANAQISVDTEKPACLRLTLDPFAGRSFQEVSKDELAVALDRLACPALTERGMRLYHLGYALPQALWFGFAPFGAGCVVKAYIASPDPLLRPWLSRLARDAGWLPPELHPAFVDAYEQFVPSIGMLEGIGISFYGSKCVGTTFYLRSALPWTAVASPVLARLLHLSPSESLGAFADVFPRAPAAVGWSIECDDCGALVDLKLEVAINAAISAERVVAYGLTMGLDTQPLADLAAAIEVARLSPDDAAVPAVLSLRFVQSGLRGMVTYYPLAIPVVKRDVKLRLTP